MIITGVSEGHQARVRISGHHTFVTYLEKDGEYLIKEEVVNSTSGSIQDEWKTLGNQEELGKSEIQYLRNVCIPKIYMKQFTCVEGKLSFHIELEPHEMRLIHISPY